MGQSVSRSDFMWTYTEQPHLSRREAIVRAHPEIKELFGIDESFKYVVTAMVLFQIFMCWLLQDSDWLLIFLEAYLCGGVMNHAMTLAIHDISHNTVFGNRYPLSNRFFGMFANLPIGVPISVSFKKYHVEHHRYLGEDGLDTDVPTELEAQLFTTPARKFVWLVFQPLFYAFRPLIIYKKAPTDLEVVNAIIQFGLFIVLLLGFLPSVHQLEPTNVKELDFFVSSAWFGLMACSRNVAISNDIAFDLFIVRFFGYRSLAYLIIGTLVAMGIHPSAGHFVSEHYVFKENQETYSYYGPWNLCTFNVGYHVEHHDFPYIPGRNLPKVSQIAPEFYDGLHTHSSWKKVLFDFVFSPDMGPYMRLKRKASVAQTFQARHALLEYLQAILKHSGFSDIRQLIRHYMEYNNDKKHVK